jgi:hypothetical protein
MCLQQTNWWVASRPKNQSRGKEHSRAAVSAYLSYSQAGTLNKLLQHQEENNRSAIIHKAL